MDCPCSVTVLKLSFPQSRSQNREYIASDGGMIDVWMVNWKAFGMKRSSSIEVLSRYQLEKTTKGRERIKNNSIRNSHVNGYDKINFTLCTIREAIKFTGTRTDLNIL
jgi:hypothetical protein